MADQHDDASPRHRAGLGVRARITAAFALGALLLSLTLAGLTYGLTRSYLVRERESSAVRQAYVNAQLLRAGLRSARPGRAPAARVARDPLRLAVGAPARAGVVCDVARRGP